MKTTLCTSILALLAGCATVDTTEPPKDGQGRSVIASGYGGIMSVNQTKKADSAAFPRSSDVVVKVATRTCDNGRDAGVFFREFTFGPDGRLKSISAETDVQGVSTGL